MNLRPRKITESAQFKRRLRARPARKYCDNVTTTDEEESKSECDEPQPDEEVPTATRRPPVVRGRGRKRHPVFEDGERKDFDFKTPVRVQRRVLSEVDLASPQNSAVRNIYSPLIRFLTPAKENSRTPRTPSGGEMDVHMSPEQHVFGYSSSILLEGEINTDDVFSPVAFIKNIPDRTQFPKPCIRDVPPKTRSTPQATLVLDLNETIMYSSLNVIENADYTFNTTFQNHQYKVYMILRPYVKDFLQAMSKVFEMFVYTSAKKEYAGKILDILDPNRKLFRYRLYQKDCTCVLGHYVKDLGVLERDLAKTVVLDNTPHTYPYHLMNTIPIKSWSGDKDDKELQKLIPYLEKIAGAEDFRRVLKRRTDHFHRLLSED